MKILMVNLPFAGHSNPTIGLARELYARGHNVAYIHSYEWEARIQATGCKFIPYRGTTPQKYHKPELKYWRVAYDTVEEELPHYDLLIYEVLFFAGKSLADKIGKPSVRLFSTFALNANILREFGMTGGLYVTALFRYDILYKPISAIVSKIFHLEKKDIVRELTENAPSLNFAYTIRDFQIESGSFPEKQYYFVGPSLANRTSPGTSTKTDYASMSRPIIYISMGTLINHSIRFYRKCFDAFGNKEMTVIIALGHGVMRESLSDAPQNIKLYPFVPQLDVLENCDLFITHGGMNSVNEALYYGVPMLVIPVGNDQPTVAKRVEAVGVGKRIVEKDTSASDLYHTALGIINDTSSLVLQDMQEKSRSAGGNKFIADMIIQTFS